MLNVVLLIGAAFAVLSPHIPPSVFIVSRAAAIASSILSEEELKNPNSTCGANVYVDNIAMNRPPLFFEAPVVGWSIGSEDSCAAELHGILLGNVIVLLGVALLVVGGQFLYVFKSKRELPSQVVEVFATGSGILTRVVIVLWFGLLLPASVQAAVLAAARCASGISGAIAAAVLGLSLFLLFGLVFGRSEPKRERFRWRRLSMKSIVEKKWVQRGGGPQGAKPQVKFSWQVSLIQYFEPTGFWKWPPPGQLEANNGELEQGEKKEPPREGTTTAAAAAAAADDSVDIGQTESGKKSRRKETKNDFADTDSDVPPPEEGSSSRIRNPSKLPPPSPPSSSDDDDDLLDPPKKPDPSPTTILDRKAEELLLFGPTDHHDDVDRSDGDEEVAKKNEAVTEAAEEEDRAAKNTGSSDGKLKTLADLRAAERAARRSQKANLREWQKFLCCLPALDYVTKNNAFYIIVEVLLRVVMVGAVFAAEAVGEEIACYLHRGGLLLSTLCLLVFLFLRQGVFVHRFAFYGVIFSLVCDTMALGTLIFDSHMSDVASPLLATGVLVSTLLIFIEEVYLIVAPKVWGDLEFLEYDYDPDIGPKKRKTKGPPEQKKTKSRIETDENMQQQQQQSDVAAGAAGPDEDIVLPMDSIDSVQESRAVVIGSSAPKHGEEEEGEGDMRPRSATQWNDALSDDSFMDLEREAVGHSVGAAKMSSPPPGEDDDDDDEFARLDRRVREAWRQLLMEEDESLVPSHRALLRHQDELFSKFAGADEL